MAVTAPPPRKYNPGFLTDDELVASFCVRTSEFESIVEMLRECTGSSNQHQIVIGPRGSGKTSLLLRVAAEVRRDAGLSAAFFPVVFAEESYEVATAGEFWLECLARLADQAPHREDGADLRLTFEDLRTIRDDRTLGERCLAALLDFSDRENKRLVLMVENLNMMFRDMADSREAGWRLRKTLQTEPRIILLASATSRFDEIDRPDHALYDLFRTLTLRPLDTSECAILWEAVSGRRAPQDTIRSLEILTGGSPRLLAIVARFGGGLSFRELMADLLDLVDDHTEYFKSHLESLPPQERRVYLALADLWKPALTKEVADRARLETSTCSAQLTRLVERGAVQVAGGTARRKQYYLSERLYNIYYLLRRNRGPDRLIEALIRFMASYYSLDELKDIGARIIFEAQGIDPEMRSLYQSAFAQLMEQLTLAEYREELRAMAPADFAEIPNRISAPSDEAGTAEAGVRQDHRSATQFAVTIDESPEMMDAKAIFSKAIALASQNRARDALNAYDEIVIRFGKSETPVLLEAVAKALSNKGAILGGIDRPKEAIGAWDEVVGRFGESQAPDLLDAVAAALFNKGVALVNLNRQEEAIDVWDEVVSRFGKSETLDILEIVATSLVNKGVALGRLNRSEEELTTYDEVVIRFYESETPALLETVATALVNKGVVFNRLDRPEEEIGAWDEVVNRFGESEMPDIFEIVAKALGNKGAILVRLDRPEEAIGVWDEVVNRFGESETPALLETVAAALVNKGVALGRLNRSDEELIAYDEVVSRFGKNKTPALLEIVAAALINKGATLGRLNRLQEALDVCDEMVRRFEKSEIPNVLEQVAKALVNKGATLGRLNRLQEALDVCDEMVRRFEKSEIPNVLEQVAKALINKGGILVGLNHLTEALDAWDEVAHCFGESESLILREWTEIALLSKANLELENRRYGAAIETIGRVLDQHYTRSPENRWRSHLIRAKAKLASGRLSACEHDIEAALTILPELGSLPKEDIDTLMEFSIALGPARMRDLIQASPASDLLLPLTTTLEWEIGMKPRVAREIEEVARDIRRDLAKLKEARTDGMVQRSDSEGEGDPATV